MNQLKGGAILSYTTIILNNIIALAYMPYMLRMLGQAEYGLYSLAASVVAYLTVLDLGYGNAIIRYTAKFRTLGRLDTQYRMYGMFIVLYGIIGVVCVIAGLILCLNVNTLFSQTMTTYEQRQIQIMLGLMTFNLAVSFPLGIFGSVISGYEKFIFQKSLNLVRVILNPLVMILFLSMGYKAICMVVITTIFNLLTLTLNYWYCMRKIKIQIIFGSFDINLLKEISYYSFWIFLCAIIDRIYWSSGQFILGMYVSASAVAIYAVAIQFQSIYMGFSGAMTSVFLPKITSLVSNKANDKVLSNLFIRVGRMQFSLLGIILFGFILFGKEFIIYWAGTEYTGSYYITLLFFIPLTIPLIQNLGFTILQAKNQMRFRSLTYLIISIISLIIAIPISKKFGGIGCACCVAGALFLGQILLMNMYYKYKVGIEISVFWTQIFKMSIAPLFLSVVTYLVLLKIPIDSILSLVIYISVYTTIYMILFWMFSFNNDEKALIKDIYHALIS